MNFSVSNKRIRICFHFYYVWRIYIFLLFFLLFVLFVFLWYFKSQTPPYKFSGYATDIRSTHHDSDIRFCYWYSAISMISPMIVQKFNKSFFELKIFQIFCKIRYPHLFRAKDVEILIIYTILKSVSIIFDRCEAAIKYNGCSTCSLVYKTLQNLFWHIPKTAPLFLKSIEKEEATYNYNLFYNSWTSTNLLVLLGEPSIQHKDSGNGVTGKQSIFSWSMFVSCDKANNRPNKSRWNLTSGQFSLFFSS